MNYGSTALVNRKGVYQYMKLWLIWDQLYATYSQLSLPFLAAIQQVICLELGRKMQCKPSNMNIDALGGLCDLGLHASDIDRDCLETCKLAIGLFYGENMSELNVLWKKLFTKNNLDSTKLLPTGDAAVQHIK